MTSTSIIRSQRKSKPVGSEENLIINWLLFIIVMKDSHGDSVEAYTHPNEEEGPD